LECEAKCQKQCEEIYQFPPPPPTLTIAPKISQQNFFGFKDEEISTFLKHKKINKKY